MIQSTTKLEQLNCIRKVKQNSQFLVVTIIKFITTVEYTQLYLI